MKGLHTKLTLEQGGSTITAIMWGFNDKTKFPEYIDILFTIVLNKWQGRNIIQLDIKSFRPYNKIIRIIKSNRTYSCSRIDQENVIINNQENKSFSFNIGSKLILESEFRNNQNNKYINQLISEALLGLGESC